MSLVFDINITDSERYKINIYKNELLVLEYYFLSNDINTNTDRIKDIIIDGVGIIYFHNGDILSLELNSISFELVNMYVNFNISKEEREQFLYEIIFKIGNKLN